MSAAQNIGDSKDVHAAAGFAGIAVTGERWDDYVEGIRCWCAVGGRIGELGDNAQEFEEGSGPTVSENERDGRQAFATHVKKMNLLAGDRRFEVREGCKALDLGAPKSNPLDQ